MQGSLRLIAVLLLLASLLGAAAFTASVALVAAPLYLQGQAVKAAGGYAPLYLYERSPYDRIVVEVHYEEKAKPSTYALEHLQSVLHDYTGKPVDLRLYGDIDPASAPSSSDGGNVTAFGSSFLDAHARSRMGWLGGTLPMYVLYIDGSAPGSRINATSAIAGLSFRADAFAVFDHYLDSEGIERTVLVHEAGHLLGLEHDDNARCAMVGALVESRAMASGMVSPPDGYCAVHREQLEEKRHSLFT